MKLAILALLLLAGCGDKHYQIAAQGGVLYRLDQRTGEVCQFEQRNRHGRIGYPRPRLMKIACTKGDQYDELIRK